MLAPLRPPPQAAELSGLLHHAQAQAPHVHPGSTEPCTCGSTIGVFLVEGPAAGVEWSPRNWLQYPTGGPPFHALGNLAPLAPLQKA